MSDQDSMCGFDPAKTRIVELERMGESFEFTQVEETFGSIVVQGHAAVSRDTND
jgi:hypothetical protein